MWQRYLGLKIDSQADDIIKFIFTQIDPDDPEKEYYCLLDLREYIYSVSEFNLPLDHETVGCLLSRLNSTRSWWAF